MSMKCRYCKYDNQPLPGDDPPDNCEGCGRPLDQALSGRPDISYEDFI